MDERERLRRLGDDTLRDHSMDDPTTVDRIPDPGSEFDDPIALGRGTGDELDPIDTGHDYGVPAERLPLGISARPGYGGAYVDPIAGEPGAMSDATYGDRLGGETPAMPPADTRDTQDAMAPEAAGGTIGALGGMVAGAIVAGPPGAIVGGIVGAVGGAVAGGAVAGESDAAAPDDDGPTADLDDPVTPGDDSLDPRSR